MASARVIELVDVTHNVSLGRVNGRAANIAALLAVYGDRINAALSGRVSFHYGQSEQIKPELVEHLEGN